MFFSLPQQSLRPARRAGIAARYRDFLDGVASVAPLPEREHASSVWHQYTVLCSQRDALQSFLADRGIGSATHYPEPLHRQPAFSHLGEPPVLEVAERAATEVLCLPMFPELTDDEVETVGRALADFET